MTALLETSIPGATLAGRGKVRDVYDLGDTLLLVATDRISAYDVVMPNGIPDKGAVLTQLSRFWFRRLRPIVPTHVVTCDSDYICDFLQDRLGCTLEPDLRRQLAGRTTLGVKARPFPVECVVRGYISGSLWNEYVQAGGPGSGAELHGIWFPAGLAESAALPAPVFTPATKAEHGLHDENISLREASEIVGGHAANRLAAVSIELYSAAAAYAARHGIIIADTKFEFGMQGDTLTLIDEALTPDSSRFWDSAVYEPGRSQPSFDKQFVRDWLVQSGWTKTPPAPRLPDDIVERTAAKYRDAYLRITGRPLASA